jgi:hypothetical protein
VPARWAVPGAHWPSAHEARWLASLSLLPLLLWGGRNKAHVSTRVNVRAWWVIRSAADGPWVRVQHAPPPPVEETPNLEDPWLFTLLGGG